MTTAFHLWSKETLVKFAEEALIKLEAQDDTIAELQVQVNRMQVQIQLAQSVAPDTLPAPCKPIR